MKLSEILNEDANDLKGLASACEGWIELWKPNTQIKIILSHPFSQQFKSSNASIIYRSVFVSEKAFNKTDNVILKPRAGIIPYSENAEWGGTARSDFDYGGDILKFKKRFSQTDLILNFSVLVAALGRFGNNINAPNESELWMKATTYYTTFTRDELIDIDKG